MKEKVVFVILHYLTTKDTKECIDSILNSINYENYEIVVVDNGSSNQSGEQLTNHYINTQKIHVLMLDKNLGFAQGNNVGYEYAKYKLNARFIIMINNDMIFTQNDFIEKVINIYSEHKYDILGPDIVSLVDHGHQNPVENGLTDVNEKKLYKFYRRTKILLYLNYLNLDKVAQTAKESLIIKRKNQEINEKKENIFNCMLHGSCLIFSPAYIDSYEGLFEKTFLYLEEDIIYYLAQIRNQKLMYSPEIMVYHKEDSSTNAFQSNDMKKRRFKYKNLLFSIRVFLELVKKEAINYRHQ